MLRLELGVIMWFGEATLSPVCSAASRSLFAYQGHVLCVNGGFGALMQSGQIGADDEY